MAGAIVRRDRPSASMVPRAMLDQPLTKEAVIGRVFRAGKAAKMGEGDSRERRI